MKRTSIAAICAVIAVAAIYQLVLGDRTVGGDLRFPTPAATIGTGSEAIVVGSDGAVLPWYPPPEEGALPELPLSEPPESGRLEGPALQQARVLGAAPPALRPYIGSSSYGESGVEVELRSGIELYFGDASRLEQKWRAAAAMLANPSIEALDYVNVLAPRRPTVGGSGHTLPPLP